MRTEDTELIIIGGGFDGLLMATEASRRGFRARVLENPIADESRDEPPGTLLQPCALASCARLDVFDAFRSAGEPLERIALHHAGSSSATVTLSYSDVDSPFPFALGVPRAAIRPLLIDTFEKYQAIHLEPDVEFVGLLHEHGRVRGIHGRSADGDVTIHGRTIIVTTGSAEVRRRAELESTPDQPYGDAYARFAVERPVELRDAAAWIGDAAWVCAYPIARDVLEVRVVARADALRAATAGGGDGLRKLVIPLAPPLETALKSLSSQPAVHVAPVVRRRGRRLTGDARVAVGDAAHRISPCSFSDDSQLALDADALARVLSKATYNGDFSRVALAKYSEVRNQGIELTASLAHDAHRIATARGGLLERARGASLERLRGSASMRRRLVRAISGFDDDPFSFGDRLRLAGLLAMRPEP